MKILIIGLIILLLIVLRFWIEEKYPNKIHK